MLAQLDMTMENPTQLICCGQEIGCRRFICFSKGREWTTESRRLASESAAESYIFIRGVDTKHATWSDCHCKPFCYDQHHLCGLVSSLSFCGTIVGVGDESREWPDSQWRSLKVQWDEPATMQRLDRLSCWEIEPLITPLNSVQPTAKGKRSRHSEASSSGSKESQVLRKSLMEKSEKKDSTFSLKKTICGW
ncbi:Arf11p [Stylosanthes scabra]|uniref:Arf11p n=1 Tax=Stylosanthes scabra TaxID=79078 RepID=A0ABU6QF31_9FABA|nr:Arf11p [Stylosanthes scabra]